MYDIFYHGSSSCMVAAGFEVSLDLLVLFVIMVMCYSGLDNVLRHLVGVGIAKLDDSNNAYWGCTR